MLFAQNFSFFGAAGLDQISIATGIVEAGIVALPEMRGKRII